MSGKTKIRERRRLLRRFRKELGVTLDEFAVSSGISKSMLSRFESGGRDFADSRWSRVLEACSALVQGEGNLSWNIDKRLAGIEKAKVTAAKLGAIVSQSLRSLSLAERLEEYALIEEPTTLEEALEQRAELLTIGQQLARDNQVVRKDLRFRSEQLAKADARIKSQKDLLGLRQKQILIQDAEQQKIEALGLEKIPDPQFDTLRHEIEQVGKKTKSEGE